MVMVMVVVGSQGGSGWFTVALSTFYLFNVLCILFWVSGGYE